MAGEMATTLQCHFDYAATRQGYHSLSKEEVQEETGLEMSPTLLYLGSPWLTGGLVFSIQGVTTVIVGLIHALGPVHGEETCSTKDSICLRHGKQIRLGSKVQTLFYSDEHRYSHRRRLGSATYNSDILLECIFV